MKRNYLVIVILVLIVFSCKHYISKDFRRNYTEYNEEIHNDTINIPYFKVHFKNGDVSVLDDWNLNSGKDSLAGQGKLYNFNRNKISEGELTFGLDDIAIIETNQLEPIKSKDKARITGLTILTGVNVLVDIICITNPKACFGSCPTFYAEGNTDLHNVNAEGFSSSISPSLELRDLDALQYSTPSSEISITMKNEAFETHMLNELYLEAVPKKKGESIYQDKNGDYYSCADLENFHTAKVENKDIRYAIKGIDENEYFSLTDSLELATKEEIILEFDRLPDDDLGIVINYRQSLLTTYLLYSGLSYMGDEVGDYFAKIETNGQIKKRLQNPFKRLGKIEFSIWNAETDKWEFIDDVYETGPIAKNLMIVPIHQIKGIEDKAKIKVELTKGLWRIDYLGITSIKNKEKPYRIMPSHITVLEGDTYSIDDVIADDEKYLVSFPGNEFKFLFELPALSDDYYSNELFLSSKGYYLEWMRREWIKGKDISKLKKMLLNDKKTWEELAKEYKTMEAGMEEVFWNSMYSPIQ